jgi:hypothetical protein
MLVPVLYGHLAGDDGGCSVVSVIDNLQQIAALFCGQRRNLLVWLFHRLRRRNVPVPMMSLPQVLAESGPI